MKMWEKFLSWWNALWSEDDVSWPHAKGDDGGEGINPPTTKAEESPVVVVKAPPKKKKKKAAPKKKAPKNLIQ